MSSFNTKSQYHRMNQSINSSESIKIKVHYSLMSNIRNITEQGPADLLITCPRGEAFPHLSQMFLSLCDRLLCPADTPHGPACHSRSALRPKPPAAWRWSSSHCRCLPSGQSHTEGEGDEMCPSTGDKRKQMMSTRPLTINGPKKKPVHLY